MLSQLHPVHTFSPCFSKIHSNIIFQSTSSSCDRSLPFRISNQNLLCISHLSHAIYMPHPSHPLWLDHSNKVWWRVQVMKLRIMQSSPASTVSPRLGPNILLSTLFWKTLNLGSSLFVTEQFSHLYKTISKIKVLYI